MCHSAKNFNKSEQTGLSLPDKEPTKPPSVTAAAQSVNNVCSAELEVLSVNTGGGVQKGKYKIHGIYYLFKKYTVYVSVYNEDDDDNNVLFVFILF